MRKIKLASATNPINDFIELNDFNGFLCTQFQTLGISRKIEFLTIKNRNIPVGNNLNFKKYSLTIEIFAKYSEYENKYYELLNFLDRNKNDGFRLYYKPFDNMNQTIYPDKTEGRYCLCSLETSSKVEKLQPIVLVFSQNSLWLGEEQVASSSATEQTDNLFVFKQNGTDYRAVFMLDEEIPNYWCITFVGGDSSQAFIENKGYNEIPLKIRIFGACSNPFVKLFRVGEVSPIRQLQVFTTIESGNYLEIDANILENGVWEVDANGNKQSRVEDVDHSNGSPYFYIGNGKYYLEVDGCEAKVFWREEYSE